MSVYLNKLLMLLYVSLSGPFASGLLLVMLLSWLLTPADVAVMLLHLLQVGRWVWRRWVDA